VARSDWDDASRKKQFAGWDQFTVNEEKFGVTTTYDENLYTTSLDRKAVPKDLEAKAAQLAAEIEGTAAPNALLAEERGQELPENEQYDEEARYSTVLRGDEASMHLGAGAAGKGAGGAAAAAGGKAVVAAAGKRPAGAKAAAPAAAAPAAADAPKSKLNPNAKEFVFNPKAKEFVPGAAMGAGLGAAGARPGLPYGMPFGAAVRAAARRAPPRAGVDWLLRGAPAWPD